MRRQKPASVQVLNMKQISNFWRGILAVTVAILSVSLGVAADAKKPNVLIIVGDDMGYADIGFHGCKDIPTPSLDGLAAAGVRFTSGYVSGPYCSPTRAGMLTGRYQTRFGHEFNPDTTGGLPLTEKTLADRLKAVGYRTGLVGKWHLGHDAEYQPLKRGFDEFYGFLGGAHSYVEKQGVMRGTEQVNELDYLTDAFGREAVAFIDKHKSEPWFLYLAFNAVHTPMHATDERLAKFPNEKDEKRRKYNAMMLAMDEAIGKVRAKLKETGLEKDTIVMFIADNGGPTMAATAQNAARNEPLRGSKRTTLEGGIRVPFLICWPAQLKPSVYDKPAIQLDLTATVLAAAGVKVSADWKQEGVDLLPYLKGEKSGTPHDALYWRFGEQMAIREGDYKLVRYDSNVDTMSGVRNQPVSSVKLYNLAKDIGEKEDLSAKMPEKVKELQAKWDEWNKLNVTPLWGAAHTDNDLRGADAARPKKAKKKKKE